MGYNAKNHTEQGGERTVIGGELEILSGAKIKADEGSTVEGFGGVPYVLPIASSETLGGVKGGGTAILIDSDGIISVNAAEYQANSEADDISELVSDFNSLLGLLRTCGLMKAQSE